MRDENMGKSKSRSLMKLGLKKPKRKFWVSTGIGTGYYMFRHTITRSDGSTARLCESKDGIERWELPVKTLSLSDMGLQRTKSGRVIPKNKVI